MDTIRSLTLAERATEAARRAFETGEAQPNPHFSDIDGDDFIRWATAYRRALGALLAADGTEGGA